MSWIDSEVEILEKDKVFKIDARDLADPSDFLWIHGRSRACVRVDHILSFRVELSNPYHWGLAVTWMLQDPEMRNGPGRVRTKSCLSWKGLWLLADRVLSEENNPFREAGLTRRTEAFRALLDLKEDGLSPEEIKLTRDHLATLNQAMPSRQYQLFLQNFLSQRLRIGWAHDLLSLELRKTP